MANGSTKTSQPVGKAALIGFLTGILVGALLGEMWGYLESMFRWMHTHDYQVAKAIHGSIIVLLKHSGSLLNHGLILAVFCSAIGLAVGLLAGTGMGVLGVRLGPGYEWIVISMLGIFLGMWLPDGFRLPFYWRMLIIFLLTGVLATSLTIRMNQRLPGRNFATPPFRQWRWVGYFLALILVTLFTRATVVGFFFITRF